LLLLLLLLALPLAAVCRAHIACWEAVAEEEPTALTAGAGRQARSCGDHAAAALAGRGSRVAVAAAMTATAMRGQGSGERSRCTVLLLLVARRRMAWPLCCPCPPLELAFTLIFLFCYQTFFMGCVQRTKCVGQTLLSGYSVVCFGWIKVSSQSQVYSERNLQCFIIWQPRAFL
jgi:hypothetical protein